MKNQKTKTAERILGISPKTSTASKTATATKTSTETSTEAYTQGNVTVTGGAGAGNTSVTISLPGKLPSNSPAKTKMLKGKKK